MKTAIRRILMLLLLWPVAAYAGGGSSLQIRLIQADNAGEAQVSADLRDVSDMLRKNLPFRRFVLAGSGQLTLPQGGSTSLPYGVSVQCSGPADRLMVILKRGRETVARTEIHLSPGRPVIVGGMPNGDGKLLVILVVR